jgi:DNA-binding Lrp family transcriptional regulator
MERIAMTQEERDWLDTLKRVRDGMLTQREAAGQLGISDRWVRSLVADLKQRGDRIVVHGLSGRESNRRIDAKIRDKVVAILRQPDWHDFGPTFAAEQLAKQHEIVVSRETLRGWMMAAGIWKSRSRKLRKVHPWRPRRSSYGELVQWDTSDHDWLEKRGERVRHLVRMIDDATSRSWGRFVEHDGTRENMGVLREYLERYGRPVEVYTDRDSMFYVPLRKGESLEQRRQQDRLTQLGRALRELGIGAIVAYSAQAKGRVERSFETDQDRLVKQLRLAKIKTMREANEFLEKEYWPEWNERFTVSPAAVGMDMHRPLTKEIDLDATLSYVENRVITNDYTFAYYGRYYQIVREHVKAGMKRQDLRVELRLNGELKACYQGRYVAIKECSSEAGHSAVPSKPAKPTRKDHNAGGKSRWMDGFWDKPSPALWQAIRNVKEKS